MRALLAIAMLCVGNLFMTFAWYWHLKKGAAVGKALPVIILISWGVAFFEYMIMVPANRIGFSAGLSVAQLKITQEVVTLCVFMPFAVFFIGEKFRLDFVWAFLCVLGAVYFAYRQNF